jgi:hypothetical protein
MEVMPQEQEQFEQPREERTVYPNQDQGFLQWLFNFRKEAITPLRNVWRGKEFNFNTQTWENPEGEVEENRDCYRVMNEKGITWSISLIESYLSPVFIVSDFDKASYNFTMREAARFIWNNLSLRYKEFKIKKTDIPRVAEEIESKIRAILLGARNNGYRDFFSTQNQSTEIKQLNPAVAPNRPSVFSSMAGMFRRVGGS